MSGREAKQRSGRGALIALAAIVVVFAAIFGWLGNYVVSGETHALDERLLRAIRSPLDPSDPWGPGWFEEAVRDVTALGSHSVLVLVTLAVVGFLAFEGRGRTAFTLVAVIVTGFLATQGLKDLFDRPRPELVPHTTRVLTRSFPSGHSMMAAVCYLSLAAIVARSVTRPRVRVYVLGFAVLVAGLIGASRVYLGVHYPSDVAAGWAAGAAWATGAWWITRWLQHRGAIEHNPELEAEEAAKDAAAAGAPSAG